MMSEQSMEGFDTIAHRLGYLTRQEVKEELENLRYNIMIKYKQHMPVLNAIQLIKKCEKNLGIEEKKNAKKERI